MWRWRRVTKASQIGGKRKSEVRVTSGCRRCAENICCLNSLLGKFRVAIWQITSKNFTKVRATRAAQLFFLIQPVICVAANFIDYLDEY